MKQLSIIGLSGAGKTCYTYAMAKTMLRGYNGINAIAKNDTVREELNAGWRIIKRSEQWPAGTDNTQRREFDCSLNLKSVMDFCWDDFKGGDLTSMNEIAEKFRSEFNAYLQNSDGLIIFVPADMYLDIMEESDDAEEKYEDLEILNSLFISNYKSLSRIPVTIVITKSDLLDDNSKQYVQDFIKDLFPPLFVKGNNMKVLIVPVSLGRGLGRGKQGESIRGEVYADPKRGNIHVPIVFNLYHFLKDCIAVEKANLGEIDKDVQERTSKLRTADRHTGLQRWWYGENRDDIKDDINNANESRRAKMKVIMELESNLDTVITLFTEDCQYYINGNKANF